MSSRVTTRRARSTSAKSTQGVGPALPASTQKTTTTPSTRRRAPRASTEQLATSSLPTPQAVVPRRAASASITSSQIGGRKGGSRWRKSLLSGRTQGSLDDRQKAVQPLAVLALNRLLNVGKEDDKDGLKLNEEVEKEYTAFKAAKVAYLSSDTFLKPDVLEPLYPDQLRNPSSPLNQLIKQSNLVTFLYLLLSSAPDQDGTRPRHAVTNLTDAAKNFLTFIVPNEAQIHDGVLKMLVGLRTQAYLSALSTERSPPSPTDFLTAPLSSYLAHDPRIRNRSATVVFTTLQNSVIEDIEAIGNDFEALKTKYDWDGLAEELRNYCDNLVEEAIVSEAEEAPSEDEEEFTAMRNSTAAPSRLSMRKIGGGEEVERTPTAGSRSMGNRSVPSIDAAAPSQIEDDSELDSIAEEKQVEEALGIRDTKWREEEEEEAAELEETNVFMAPEQMEIIRALRRVEEFDGEESMPQSDGPDESSLETVANEKTIAGELAQLDQQALFDSETSDEPEELLGLRYPPQSYAQALRALQGLVSDDEEDDDADEVDQETPRARAPKAKLFRSVSPEIAVRNDEATATRLAFGGDNVLKRVAVAGPSRIKNLLERQDDAEKIDFDDDESLRLQSPQRRQRGAAKAKEQSNLKGKGKGKGKQSLSPIAVELPQGRATRSGRVIGGVQMAEDSDALEDGGDNEEDELEEVVEFEREVNRREGQGKRWQGDDDQDYFFSTREYGGGLDEEEQNLLDLPESDRTRSESVNFEEVNVNLQKKTGKRRQREVSVLSTDSDSDREKRALLGLSLPDMIQHLKVTQQSTAAPSTSSRPSTAQAMVLKPEPLRQKSKSTAEGEDDVFESDSGSVDEEVKQMNRNSSRRRMEDLEDESINPQVPSKSGSSQLIKRAKQGNGGDDNESTEGKADGIILLAERRKKPRYTDVDSSDDSGRNNPRELRRNADFGHEDVDDESEDSDEAMIKRYHANRVMKKTNNAYLQDRNRKGRIPWSHAETNCLLKAMNELGNRDWTKIMGRHGPHGVVNQILKERTPVSCKDRAVNIKVDMCRQGLALPWFLEDLSVGKRLDKYGLKKK